MEELLDFLDQRTVRAVFEAGGQDRGKLEVLGAGRQQQHVVFELSRRKVLHRENQARPMIHQQTGGVILRKSRILE